MKNKLKGKMVKTERPKLSVENVNCECLSCNWQGLIESTKTNINGDLLCPKCKEKVIVFED